MKKFLLYIIALLAPTLVVAQSRQLLEIDASTFAPVQTDAISGVTLDKIKRDPSQRPCARIKMHINRMTKEEIQGISVRPVGGSVVVTRQVVATEGNGLIVEMTAKAPTRFYLHHDKYGDSNEVSLNLEGDKEYKLEAMLNTTHSIVVSSNTIGADVYIDDVFKGKISNVYTLTISDVYPGKHNIKVKEGSLESVKDVEVNNLNIHFRLDLNHDQALPQYLLFEVEPKTSTVVIDGKNYVPNEYGEISVMLNNGSYSYSVSAKYYHDEKGEFIVSGKKVEMKVKLRPAFGWLKVPNTGKLMGANVYIDGNLVGETPITSDKLLSGEHTVSIVRSLYKTHEAKVVIEDNKTLDYTPELIPNFANVTLTSGSESDKFQIYVNGKRKGTSPWSGDLEAGAYIFEARKEGYRSTSMSKTIEATPAKQSYVITAPTPIYGLLDVNTTPANAEVYVDNVLVGKTPLTHKVVVGSHVVSISKEGFNTTKQSVTIEENKPKKLNLTLTQKSTSYSSSSYSPSKSSYSSSNGDSNKGSSSSSSNGKFCLVKYISNSAIVYVNGQYKGYANRSYHLNYGNNYVVVMHNGSYYGRTFYVSGSSGAVLNMAGAPKVNSIYSPNSSSKSTHKPSSSSYNYKTTKASNKDDDFRVGIMADMAMILYDYTMFGLGVGINSGTKHNSIFPIFLGARWMAGFDNSHVIGFPFTINLNWLGLFAIDSVSLYSGFGVEPCWMKYNDRWSDYEDSVVKGWDCPLIVNLLGVSARHHDFNLYMNISLIDDDNITFGGRYTYFF